jgi:adenosine deaminase
LSVLADFAADGVVYLELRTTPRALPGAGLSEQDYVQTILDAVAEFEQAHAADPEPKLRTKLILSVRLVFFFFSGGELGQDEVGGGY